MKNILTALSLSVVLCLGTIGSAWGYELQKEKRAQIKTVAVVSIYGPHSFSAAFGSFEQKDNYSYAEEKLVDQLKQNQLELVPWDKIKLVIENEYDDTFLGFMRPEHRDHIQKLTKVDQKNWLTLFGILSKIIPKNLATSSNTSLVVDYYYESDKDPPRFSETFRKSLAKLTKSMNTDAALIVRVIPGIKNPPQGGGPMSIGSGIVNLIGRFGGDHAYAVVELSLINGEGEVVFHDVVAGHSKDGMGVSGFNLNYDPKEVTKTVRQAIDEAMATTFQHFNGK